MKVIRLFMGIFMMAVGAMGSAFMPAEVAMPLQSVDATMPYHAFYKKITTSIAHLHTELTHAQLERELEQLQSIYAGMKESAVVGEYDILKEGIVHAVRATKMFHARTLIASMRYIEEAKLFWQVQSLRPYYYLLKSGPHGCLSRWYQGISAQECVSEHIQCLTAYEQEMCIALSSIALEIDALSHGSIDARYEVARCTGIQHHEAYDNETISSLISYAREVHESHQQTQTKIEKHAVPGHVSRYWYWYSMAAIASCYAGKYVYVHKDEIPVWKQRVQDAINNFYKLHMEKPYQEVCATLFKKREKPADKLDAVSELWEKRALQHDRTKDSAWVSSTVYGWLADIARSLGFITGELQKRVEEIDTLWELNRLNLVISAVIPVVLVGYAGYKIVRGSIQACLPRSYNFSFHRMHMREVAYIINHYVSDDAPMKACDHGKLVYHLYELAYYINQLTAQDRITFTRDIQDLQSAALSYQQKMNVINRMHQTYAFLSPQYMQQ